MKRHSAARGHGRRVWVGMCIGLTQAFTAAAQTSGPPMPGAPNDSEPKPGFAEAFKPSKPSKPARANRGAAVPVAYAPIQSTSDDGQIAEIGLS
jgi:hypothetical protein